MIAPGLPSELLEPALSGAFSLCLRQFLATDLADADVAILVEQTRAIMRVALCARGDCLDDNGVHATIAAGNLLRSVETLADASPDARRAILAPLAAYAR